MSCLDENTVVDLLQGRAIGRRLADVENHLAICDDCVQLVADTGGTVFAVAPRVPVSQPGNLPAITTLRRAPDQHTTRVEAGSLAPGTALNETYRVIRFIGHGGMGEVYEVAHARLSGRYAAKVLTTQISATDEIVSRFLREAHITSALRHPNIVQVVDFNWTSDGRPFLAMEYLEGVHLGRVIQAEGPMSLVRVRQIVAPIVSALGAVHRSAVIHRDLKPQNIMLVPGSDGAGEVVKLLDFGLSKRTGRGPSESLLVSRQRMLLGTPLYMAPEQARGDCENVGSAADQFALAAIIYEMLTQRAAFAGDTVEAVLYRIAHVQPEPMSQLVASIPVAIDQVVRRALSKDAAARFPSIGAFFDAFRDAAGAPSSLNTPLPTPVSKPARRVPRATAGVAGLVLVAGVGLTILLRASGQPHPGVVAAHPVSSQPAPLASNPTADEPPGITEVNVPGAPASDGAVVRQSRTKAQRPRRQLQNSAVAKKEGVAAASTPPAIPPVPPALPAADPQQSASALEPRPIEAAPPPAVPRAKVKPFNKL